MPAAPIHLGSLPWPRLKRAALSLFRLLADSENTDEVVIGEEITSQGQLAYWLENGIFDSKDGQALLRERALIAETNLDDLRVMEDGSLGREFARFLDDQNICLDGLNQPTPYTEGETESYLMRRVRQSHDLWHVLLGLGTRGHEEVLVHCFSVAQTGFPFSWIIIFFGALKHMVLERRWSVLTQETRRAYRYGQEASPILTAYWERRWELPLADVRKEFGIQPLSQMTPA